MRYRHNVKTKVERGKKKGRGIKNRAKEEQKRV